MTRRLTVVVAVVALLTFPNCKGKDNTLSPSLRIIWTVSGTGNTVLDMPAYINRVRVIGTFAGSSSNFIVWVGTNLLVNELLGTTWGPLRYEGVHATTGGLTRIENSTQVAWQLTEVR